MAKRKKLPSGCGYQGYEFGAAYPDSECFGGRLYDMDNCDDKGGIYEPSEYIPCPMCHRGFAIVFWTERNMHMGVARAKAHTAATSLVDSIRRNRANGTEPWKDANA